MRNILILFLALAIVSCKQDGGNHSEYAIVSGEITNKQGVVTINSFDRTFSKALEFDTNGRFVDTVDTYYNKYVIFDGSTPVFIHVEPGFNINISYDANNFDNTISITGKGAEISNYLVKSHQIERQYFVNAENAYALDEAQFKKRMNAMKYTKDSVLHSIEGIPSDYVSLEKRNLHYFYLRLLSDYESGHKHFSKNYNFKTSKDFLEELHAIDYQNETDFEFSEYYQTLLKDYYKDKANTLSKAKAITIEDAYFEVFKTIENERIKNGLLFDFAEHQITRTRDIEAFYKNYMAIATDEVDKDIIRESYNKLNWLAKGNPSPKFINYKNYDGSTTSLDDLKGKYVYIDVWATWCGPCVKEIPFLKKVEKEYHDKNIEFVSISVDEENDFDKWKTMVADKALGGLHLFADKSWYSQFVKDYDIQGIPRFILIDPNGNIVDASAPRPSNPKLKDLLNTLNL